MSTSSSTNQSCTQSQSTTPDSNTRSAIDIAWSCIAVIFACTWTAIHPNVPPSNIRSSQWRLWRRRAVLTLWALLVPELMVQLAVGQWLEARRASKVHETLRIRRSFDAAANRSKARSEENTSEKGQPKEDIRWTKVQSFFLVMHGFTVKSYGHDIPLSIGDMQTADRLNQPPIPGHPSVPWPEISAEEDEIKDKSKGDALAKTLVVVQTTWFLIQLLARRIEHLATTELEIMTLAYALLSGVLYAFWWNKPYDVQKPIQIESPTEVYFLQQSRKAKLEIDRTDIALGNVIFKLHSKIVEDTNCRDVVYEALRGKLTLGNTLTISLTVSFIAGTIFGAIHCIAWNFQFPNPAQRVLWITCSMLVTVVPSMWAIMLLLLRALGWIRYSPYHRKIGRIVEYVIVYPLFSLTPIFLYSYFICRIVLLVQAFVLLGDLPPSATQSVQWSSFVPHI